MALGGMGGDEQGRPGTSSDITEPMSGAEMVEPLSTAPPFNPGDVIATGTPNGAGARFDPPKFLTEGDVVEVEVPGIGALKNTVKTEVV